MTAPLSKRKPKVLIVLSAPRSGSSALTSMLKDMGLDAGPEWQLKDAEIHNRYGFFENIDLLKLNEEILAQNDSCIARTVLLNLGMSTDEAGLALNYWHWCGRLQPCTLSDTLDDATSRKMRQIIASLDDSNGTPIWKDARFCMTLPLWERYITPVCILLWRHPHQVARSLEKMTAIPFAEAVKLWYAYTRAAVTVTEPHPRFVTAHHRMLDDPESTARLLARFLDDNGVPISTDRLRQAATRIDKSQCRERGNAGTMDTHWPAQTASLLAWLRDPAGGAPETEPLDASPLLPLVGALHYFRRTRTQKVVAHLRKVPGYHSARESYRRIRHYLIGKTTKASAD